MYEHYRYHSGAIQRASDGISSSPYGVIEDMLEDVLFLGAVALHLKDAVPYSAGWVADHQDTILADRDNGYSFAEVVPRAQTLAAAKEWMSQFCAAVYPEEDNPKDRLLEFGEALEELSFSGAFEVDFVAHAFLLTEPAWRAQMLINLAAVE
ncbi:hypothetical protein [Arthrobacter bambusae]|uniref:hypothetical protein n=1 Tax=Arthrobacter bambusae TaxID=1338426 RepID=UPI00278624C9|nr:hypothetical protein [Arthrobacter bambusae]MDQ0212536.1 hypothetical protein [Arthrobacter bambusae]MDQ0235970.1 hypothetical protein [Arthrobacter bambusae]